MNSCDTPNYYYYTSYIFGALINLFIVNTINNIEKNIECKCSYGTEEKIIYWYLLILFIIFLTSLLLIIFFILILSSINK